MPDACRKHHQIALLDLNPDPLLAVGSLLRVDAPPYIEIASSIEHISDLLVLVQVFGEKDFQLLMVRVAHGGRRNVDFIPILVGAGGSKLVDGIHGRVVGGLNPQSCEGREIEWGRSKVGSSLVGLVGEALDAGR